MTLNPQACGVSCNRTSRKFLSAHQVSIDGIFSRLNEQSQFVGTLQSEHQVLLLTYASILSSNTTHQPYPALHPQHNLPGTTTTSLLFNLNLTNLTSSPSSISPAISAAASKNLHTAPATSSTVFSFISVSPSSGLLFES